eukprot:scaffold11351_cov141-Isochrysis_galbana.AAC.3
MPHSRVCDLRLLRMGAGRWGSVGALPTPRTAQRHWQLGRGERAVTRVRAPAETRNAALRLSSQKLQK